jgi:long-chain-fatty-acid--[acyl-carrier-protein] ligase
MLLVRGPNVFGGYLGEAPDPFVEFAGDIWYRTGDLVRMDAGGRLVFCGRLKRFVKIGGEMISLPQMEAVLQEAFSTRDDIPEEGPSLAVEAGAEEIRPQIALFTPMNIDVTEANAALRRAGLSPLYSITRVVRMETVPLLGSGKTDYRTLKKHLMT